MNDLEQHILALPYWQGKPEIAPLVGGLSNISYVATDRTGKYVVRIGQDYPFHHVSRERELMTARAAHAAGFAPEIVYDEPGLMVSRYIAGKVFTADDVRDNIKRIAEIVHRFHNEMPAKVTGSSYIFWVFHVIRDYANTLKQSHIPLTSRLPELLDINEQLEAFQTPLKVIFGHNDLLPANIIDDGERLWLIDFEYGGFGTAMFDLAGLASNAGFNEAESAELLATYFPKRVSDEIRMSHAGMQCASLLREALWSLVSSLYLAAPGADYAAYAAKNFARFDEAVAAYKAAYPKGLT